MTDMITYRIGFYVEIAGGGEDLLDAQNRMEQAFELWEGREKTIPGFAEGKPGNKFRVVRIIRLMGKL